MSYRQIVEPKKPTASREDAPAPGRPAEKPPATAAPTGAGTIKVPPVEVVGMGPAFGMAQVIAGLCRQAAAKDPERAARMRRSVALQNSDYTSGVTIHFEGERIRVLTESDPGAPLLIEGPAMTFGKLGSIGYAVKAYLRREIKVRGMFRHPVLLAKLQRLVSVLDLS